MTGEGGHPAARSLGNTSLRYTLPSVDPRFARRLARFNKHVTNRLTLPLAPRLPWLGVVAHVGRRSGRTYRTPVNVFSRHGGFVFALPYGRQAQWVQNVLQAGQCELTTRGQDLRADQSEIFRDETRHAAAPVARPMLRLVGASEFMRMDAADPKPTTPQQQPEAYSLPALGCAAA